MRIYYTIPVRNVKTILPHAGGASVPYYLIPEGSLENILHHTGPERQDNTASCRWGLGTGTSSTDSSREGQRYRDRAWNPQTEYIAWKAVIDVVGHDDQKVMEDVSKRKKRKFIDDEASSSGPMKKILSLGGPG